MSRAKKGLCKQILSNVVDSAPRRDRRDSMPAIHLIKNDPALPNIIPIQPGSDIYRSGYWAVSEDRARALINGTIYFHEEQAKPSFHGGLITAIEKVNEGQYAGRIVFTFRFDRACRGVSTSKDGWLREKKFVD